MVYCGDARNDVVNFDCFFSGVNSLICWIDDFVWNKFMFFGHSDLIEVGAAQLE